MGQLLKKKMKAVKAMEYRYEREAQNRTEMPETEEAIYLRFDGATAIPVGKTVLDLHLDEMTVPEEDGEARVLARNISLFVRGSEKGCIMGRNCFF